MDGSDPKDHWEALFNKEYLRWFDLQGREIRVTIKKVDKDVKLTLPGGAKKNRPVIHFDGAKKPLVLNVTNAGSIAAMHGNRPSAWVGKQVVLYPTTTQCKGETKDCIRIKGAKDGPSKNRPSQAS